MSGSKQIMVSTFISSIIVALLLVNGPYMTAYAAPQAGAASAASSSQQHQQAATTTTTTTSTSNSAVAAGSSAASGAAGGGAASAAAASAASGGHINAPLAGVQGLVGGALNIAAVPLNTISASLNQLGVPTLATAPLSAVGSLFQQAGTVYGR